MLAKTSFASGIDEELIAVDAYAVNSPAALLGSAGSSVPLSVESLQGLLGGGMSNPAALITNFTSAQGITVDAKALQDGILQALPGAQGVMSQLPTALSSSLLAGGGASQVQATISGVTAMINKADLTSVTGVSKLIGSVSGADFPIQFKDVSGLSTLGVNLLKQAGTMGIPRAYTQFAAGMSGSASGLTLLGKITQGILPSVVSTSNVGMLAEIANGPVAGQILSMVPGLPRNFLSVFKLPKKASAQDIVRTGVQLFGALSKINPTWNKGSPGILNRPQVSASASNRNSYGSILGGSSDLKKLLDVFAKAKTTPLVVRPTITRAQPPAAVPPESSEFQGATSTSGVNVDGSTWRRFQLPNGTVATRTDRTVSGTQVITTVYEYPPQGCPRPQARQDASIYRASTVNQNYNYPSSIESAPQVIDSIDYPAAVNFGGPSYGNGAYGVSSAAANVSGIKRVVASSGASYTERTYDDGTVEREKIESATGAGFNFGVDPFANTSADTLSDPILLGYIVSSAQQKNASSLLNMGSSQALRQSFPLNALEGIENFEIYE